METLQFDGFLFLLIKIKFILRYIQLIVKEGTNGKRQM
jgi:hypothetical protein